MAFDPTNMIALDRSPRTWHYETDDALADIDEEGMTGTEGSHVYFSNTICDRMFRSGELLQVEASDGKALYRIVSAIPSIGSVALSKLAAVAEFTLP